MRYDDGQTAPKINRRMLWVFFGVIALGFLLIAASMVFATKAEGQSLTSRYYYTVDVITIDDGDEDHNPLLLGSLQDNETWEQVYFDLGDGFWIIRVCAPTGRHTAIAADSNNLGDTLALVKADLDKEVSLAALRGSIAAQWAMDKPPGSTDPLDILKVPTIQC